MHGSGPFCCTAPPEIGDCGCDDVLAGDGPGGGSCPHAPTAHTTATSNAFAASIFLADVLICFDAAVCPN
jgi:hypothetical protein